MNAKASTVYPRLGLLGLVCLLCVAAAYYASLLNTYPPEADGAQNLRYAYNLYKHGIYSASRDESAEEIERDSRREPFYPFLLSMWMLALDLDTTEVSKSCLLENDDHCANHRRALMWLNVALLLLTVALSACAGFRITGSVIVALGAAALVSVNDLLYHGLQRHHTEILAALLLLLHAFALWLFMTGAARAKTAMLAGLALGLLALTKAIFYYWIVLLVPATVLVWVWRDRAVARYWMVMIVSALVVVVPWQVRNELATGDTAVSGRGGEVLAIRAEFGDISRQEFVAAFVYYNPILKARYLEHFPPAAYARLGRGADSFYTRGKSQSGIVGARAASRTDENVMLAAIGFMVERWETQLALTALFFYRGFISVADEMQSLVSATLPSIGFLIGTVYIWFRRRDVMWFVLPAWFALAFYSSVSHFIPRFSAPLYPLVTVASLTILCVAIGNWRSRGDKIS